MTCPSISVFQQAGFNNIKTFVEEELQTSMVSIFLKILRWELISAPLFKPVTRVGAKAAISKK